MDLAMAPDDPMVGSGLRSVRSTHRLNQIDRIRANGIGDQVSLPQLVVCGDQSAGKSSVLEGITEIPFPRQDGVCTRFPTEIVLRHAPEVSRITATIIPHASRTETEKERLRSFHRVLENLSEIPGIITQAAISMRIRGSEGIEVGPAFAVDVLRIEVVGNTGLHLTVVDLPGLIAVASDEQTDEDVKLVANMVDSYLENSRTIVLAVVQASNDIANQGIIQRARAFDKAGQRTVGIITKPDLINEGTEARIALLASNKDTTKLRLGYFLLKNPSPAQLHAGMTLKERRREEQEFFNTNSWRKLNIDTSRVGIEALRLFLQDLLDQHIEHELPKVRAEVKRLLSQAQDEMAMLGDARPTLAQKRLFLTKLSMQFYQQADAALDGNYQTATFPVSTSGSVSTHMRLRANVHQLNTKFATYMRENGQKRKEGACRFSDDCTTSEAEDVPSHEQLLVSKKEFDHWIHQVYVRSRGRELPGNYNYVLLSELFREQSSRWATIAANHLADIADSTASFVEETLQRIVVEDKVRQALQELTRTKLDLNEETAREELHRLVEDEHRQPITYNHYYTDNIQKARQDHSKKALIAAMQDAVQEDWNGKLHVSNTPYDMEKLRSSLQNRAVIVDMDEQACAEAAAGLKAYYKVAMKTFVDNVCRQVVERHLLSNLPGIFAPPVVMSLPDEDLLCIASEPEKQRKRRKTLEDRITALDNSMLEMRK